MVEMGPKTVGPRKVESKMAEDKKGEIGPKKMFLAFGRICKIPNLKWPKLNKTRAS
jgi:hypothetical protein